MCFTPKIPATPVVEEEESLGLRVGPSLQTRQASMWLSWFLPALRKSWVQFLAPYKPGVVVSMCNPSTHELGTWSQDLKVICSHIVRGVLETLSQKIGRPQSEITADQFGFSAHGQRR